MATGSKPSAASRAEVEPAALPELRPGDEVLERFRLERRLGEGGTGVVFEATELATGHRHALKALRAPRAHRAHLLKSEFRAVRDFAHPRLVTVHELFVRDEQAFMTMELVHGAPLTEAARAAAEQGRWESVRALFGQCAVGIAALHAHGLLHRDLKPSNVLVDASGDVTILDFGLAFDDPALRHAGTRPYMAPEQLAGEPSRPATDWYALGLMLYEVLSGSSPSDVPRSQHGDTRPLHRLDALHADAAPPDLAALCRDLLAFAPSRRASCERILDVLGAEREVPTTQRASFVGRGEELQALHQAFAEAQRQGPRWVIVRGDAGAGKTRLVGKMLREARDRHQALVLRASCSQYEHVAFNAFDGIVEGAKRLVAEGHAGHALDPRDARSLTCLFPALSSAFAIAPKPDTSGHLPREERQAGFRALGQMLSDLGATRPVILWIDDAQWADDDSLELLRSLLGFQLENPPLLIGCVRTDDRPSTFEQTAASSAWGGRTLELGRMSETDALRMSALALREPSSHPVVRRVAAESQGHPLLIEQLAALGEPEPEGATVERALRQRIDELSAGERELLELIGCHGQPLDRAIVYDLATDCGGPTLVKNLCVRRLCLLSDDTVDTYHGKIRDAVHARLGAEQRRVRHRTLYDRHAARDDSPPRLLAEHAIAASLHEEAFGHLCDAAEQAQQALAFHQAAKHLQGALDLPSAVLSPRRESHVRKRLARALEAAGRGPDAAEQYLALASRAAPSDAQEYRCCAAEQLLLSGRRADGILMLNEILDALGTRVPRTKSAVLASLLAGRVRLRVASYLPARPPARAPTRAQLHRVDALAASAAAHSATDTLRGAWFAGRQLREAERTGDPARIVRALLYEVLYLANEGGRNAEPVAATLRRVRAHVRRTSDIESQALLRLAEGASAVLIGRWTEGVARLREAETQLAQPGCRRWFELNLCRQIRAFAQWFTGTTAEMQRSLAIWIEDARERGDEAAVRSLSAERPLVALIGDRPGESSEHIARLERYLTPGVLDESRVVSLHNRMHHALYVGEAPDAMLTLVRGIQPLWRSLLGRGQLVRVTSRLYAAQVMLDASLQRGTDPALLRRAERAARRLESEKGHYPRLHAGLLRSAVDAQRGRREAAWQRISQVASGLADDDQRLYAAGARWRLGELTGGERGRALVAHAHGTMRQLGVAQPERFVRVVAAGFPENP